MWFSSDHRGVCIFVRGRFVAPGEWLIQATVESGWAIDGTASAASRQRTVSALWWGIHLEQRVGDRLGARVVRVAVDGDPDIASVFATTTDQNAHDPMHAPPPLGGVSFRRAPEASASH